MRKLSILFFFLISLSTVTSQTTKNVYNLQSPILDETSGLIFYNNKLITHNDSEGEAKLYEIDVRTGAVTRTVVVKNATNLDWEDIAQDKSYIYIGDIGNNLGNRTDLKIYKILKKDYDDNDDSVTPEIINFSYLDQTDFTSKMNGTNWDAEALISYGDNLLVFSKNWEDNKVSVYSIPKKIGTHKAILEGSYNSNGLITGAETNPSEDIIYLTGYSTTESPFMFSIQDIPKNSLNIFSGKISEKISNIAPFGNQVEAISLFEITPNSYRFYISNERFVANVGKLVVTYPAKLRILEISSSNVTLDIPNNFLEKSLNLYQNPYDKTLTISEQVDEIIVYNLLGKIVAKQHYVKEISLNNLQKGVYIVHIDSNNSKIVKKIIIQ